MFRFVRFFFIGVISLQFGVAQELIKVDFKASLNSQELFRNVSISDSLPEITKLQFYISNIQLLNNEEVVWSDSSLAHLIVLSDSSESYINLQVDPGVNFNRICFQLGIDSALNTAGVLGGDLDPTKGMYWSWQSGYVNIKIEGISSAINSPQKEFTYHLGGYRSPYLAVQSVDLKVGSHPIVLNLKLDDFFSNISIQQSPKVMRPCNEAVELSKLIAKSIVVDAP